MSSAWRFIIGLTLGLALGAAVPVLATSSGGARGGVPTSVASDEIDATFTTTSTTYVDVTGLTMTATATLNERWLVTATTMEYGSVANGVECYTRIDLDGTALVDFAQSTETSTNAVRQSRTITALTGALTATPHTIKLRARVSSGTANIEKDVVDAISNSLEAIAWR